MDDYDSMDAEEERAWRLQREAEEEPPCLEGDGIEPERHDHEILVSGGNHDPVGLICSCGKRYRVVPE